MQYPELPCGRPFCGRQKNNSLLVSKTTISYFCICYSIVVKLKRILYVIFNNGKKTTDRNSQRSIR